MPRLDVYLDSNLQFQVQLKDEPFWIGRGSDCQVSLNDPQISHHHALVSNLDGGWIIRNEGRNGTRLNAKVLTGPAPLRFGDRLYLGSYAVVFQDSEADVLKADLSTPTTARDQGATGV